MTISVASIAAEKIGAYIYYGQGIDAAAAAGTAAVNAVSVAEDLTIVGSLGTTTITAAAQDSARTTAEKINAVSGSTGVSATAQTYVRLASDNASSESYAIKINGVSSGNFTISSSKPEDAVRAINSVAGSTGVTEKSTATGSILLFDNDGDDITIENDAAGTSLEVQKMNYLGTETVGVSIDLAASGGNDATRVSGSIKTVSNDPFNITQAGTDSDNVAAVKTTTADRTALGAATYNITLANTGETISITTAGTAITDWQAAIDATSLVGKITASEVGGKVVLTGITTLGNFGLTNAGGADQVNGAASTAGEEGEGQGYFVTGTAALSKVSDINVSTQAGAGLAISVADAALDTVAKMRAGLGAIDNRLTYTMDNLINVSEKTEAARSRIEDADFALESAKLAKAQVLQQAGTSMLAQANQMTQLVLDLIR
jgi:flagellin